jgi:hypothetical protein
MFFLKTLSLNPLQIPKIHTNLLTQCHDQHIWQRANKSFSTQHLSSLFRCIVNSISTGCVYFFLVFLFVGGGGVCQSEWGPDLFLTPTRFILGHRFWLFWGCDWIMYSWRRRRTMTNGTGGGSTFRFIFAEFNMTRLWEVVKLGGAAVSLLAVFFFYFLNFRYCGTEGGGGVIGPTLWWDQLVRNTGYILNEDLVEHFTNGMESNGTSSRSLSLSLYLAQCIPEGRGAHSEVKWAPFTRGRCCVGWKDRSLFRTFFSQKSHFFNR